jgi:cyclopropane-fatty-acyl-phospholipid synthase
MKELLGDRAHVSTPILSMVQTKKTPDDDDEAASSSSASSSSSSSYELFTTDGKSVGWFDQVIFACHPPTTKSILSTMMSSSSSSSSGRSDDDDEYHHRLTTLLSDVDYADNIVYVHSDPQHMPQRRRAWASWNCLGQSQELQQYTQVLTVSHAKRREAMEGADSGFGNKAMILPNGTTSTTMTKTNGTSETTTTSSDKATLTAAAAAAATDENEVGSTTTRMKAVYVTYWLNRLQNLDTDQDIFVTLNPPVRPDPSLTHHVVHMAHPQFTTATLQARAELLSSATYQGKDGLWFCGAWGGYGFHEDGCRSGFEVATALSGIPLPWVNDNNNTNSTSTSRALMVLTPPDLSGSPAVSSSLSSWWRVDSLIQRLHKAVTYDWPVAVCKKLTRYFLNNAIRLGRLEFKLNDGTIWRFGDGSQCGCDDSPVTIRVFDEWLFVKIAWEYDLGLARSYMAGHFVVEPLKDAKDYDSVIKPLTARSESTMVLGDPVGLTRMFLLILGNRDSPLGVVTHSPRTSYKGYNGANILNAGLLLSKIGSFLNFFRYRLTMDNSERGGSLKNIHAHYDISNDLFTSFLDKETLMYSSAIYDAVKAPTGRYGLVFRGTLEEAQWRKLDVLLDRAQVQPGQRLLDIGFGWGGLSLHAARKYGCQVTGITLSVEQKALAEQRVAKEGLGHLITFEVVDYRKFARRKENLGKFDRVLSCEMIEAVGHDHLVEFFWAVEQVLSPNGVLVMEAITTTEERYENYLRSTDFINTVIFPGSCCPSLHALVDAAYRGSRLTLEHIDNIGLHYAQTLAEWRRRFNANEDFVRKLGFDDIFLRCWNYYMSYCEAGFYARNVNCLVLVFGRQGCSELMPLYETRSVIQETALTDTEISNWLGE